jgi:hypothetical protein
MDARGRLSLVDTSTGEPEPTAGWPSARPQPFDKRGDEVVGWCGQIPVVQTTTWRTKHEARSGRGANDGD